MRYQTHWRLAFLVAFFFHIVAWLFLMVLIPHVFKHIEPPPPDEPMEWVELADGDGPPEEQQQPEEPPPPPPPPEPAEAEPQLFRPLSHLRMITRRTRMRSLCRLFQDSIWSSRVRFFIRSDSPQGCFQSKGRLQSRRVSVKMAVSFAPRCNEAREILCGIFRSAGWSKRGGSLSPQRISTVSRWNLILCAMLSIDIASYAV